MRRKHTYVKEGGLRLSLPPPNQLYIRPPGLMSEHENVDPPTEYVVIVAQPVK